MAEIHCDRERNRNARASTSMVRNGASMSELNTLATAR
jgi:hypothetical protein